MQRWILQVAGLAQAGWEMGRRRLARVRFSGFGLITQIRFVRYKAGRLLRLGRS
jgi:hypothetical protein